MGFRTVFTLPHPYRLSSWNGTAFLRLHKVYTCGAKRSLLLTNEIMGRLGIVLAIIALLSTNCKHKVNIEKKTTLEQTMSKNFENFIANAWNHKNMDSLKSLTVENFTREFNGITVVENKNELEANMNIYFTGFPDLKVSIKKTAVIDHHLFTSWIFEGTNTGTFGESPPTGKKVVINGFSEITFTNEGKLIKEDVYYNELALLQQLGYMLTPPIVE